MGSVKFMDGLDCLILHCRILLKPIRIMIHAIEKKHQKISHATILYIIIHVFNSLQNEKRKKLLETG